MTIALEGRGRARVVVDGRELVGFGGCDYLGLSAHPEVLAALEGGLARFGVSAGASRTTTGSADEHEALEVELAAFLGLEAAVLLPEGWLADVAAAESLAADLDLALVDARAHASLFAAARAAGLALEEFAHADPIALVQRLDRHPGAKPLVASDGLFPALARCAPVAAYLRALPAGGFVLLDDAHGLGVLGARGRGTLEQAGVEDARVLLSGTLSKALGCYGGFVAGARARVEAVRSAPSFVGTTPIPPALAAAARAALRVLARGEELRDLRERTARLRAALGELAPPQGEVDTPVLAMQSAGEDEGLRLHAALREDGLLVPWVRYPGGPHGEATGWLRVAVSAAHTDEDVERLAASLRRHGSPSP